MLLSAWENFIGLCHYERFKTHRETCCAHMIEGGDADEKNVNFLCYQNPHTEPAQVS